MCWRFQNPGSYTATYLSLNGKEILANPGTPPTSTYSVRGSTSRLDRRTR